MSQFPVGSSRRWSTLTATRGAIGMISKELAMLPEVAPTLCVSQRSFTPPVLHMGVGFAGGQGGDFERLTAFTL
jgi:hypothetical protein